MIHLTLVVRIFALLYVEDMLNNGYSLVSLNACSTIVSGQGVNKVNLNVRPNFN